MPMSEANRKASSERMKALQAKKRAEREALKAEAEMSSQPAEIKDGKPDYLGTRISVAERKLKHEALLKDPFARTKFEVPLTGRMKGWQWRTASADPEHPNRHYQIIHQLNYEPVRPEDLSCSPESIGFTVSPAGYIVRGTRGQELLVAKPKEEYLEVQMAKARRNDASLRPTNLRHEVAQATSKQHGDEAGDQVFDNFSQKETQERLPDDI